MTKPNKRVNISFLRVIEVNAVEKVEEGDQLICGVSKEIDPGDKQANKDDKKSKQRLFIHRELLEATSDFFRNALEEER